MTLQQYLEKRDSLITNQENILIAAKQASRTLTEEENTIYNNADKEISEIEDTVDKIKSFDNKVKDNELLNSRRGNFDSPQEKQEEMSLGEFCSNVAKVRMGGEMTEEFKNAALGHSANVPSDGGFLISPTRNNEIMKRIYDGGQLLSQCAVLEVGSNSDSYEVPYVDETSRANGSRWGGIRVYREGEVETPTSTKTKLGKWECRLTDLKGLVYATERLLEDTVALESLINEQIDQEFTFTLEDEIFRGAGGAQCHGLIDNPATVLVAKETGQTADTIVYENLVKMYSRMWGKLRQTAKWYINQDIEPELFSMALSVGTGGVPVFTPANGLSVSPYNTLFGKEIVPMEQCSTVGDVGDINFFNAKEYAIVRKGKMRQASSIHVKFLTDQMTFKFNMRVNGKSKWKTSLTPANGTKTLSPFVQLAERA